MGNKTSKDPNFPINPSTNSVPQSISSFPQNFHTSSTSPISSDFQSNPSSSNPDPPNLPPNSDNQPPDRPPPVVSINIGDINNPNPNNPPPQYGQNIIENIDLQTSSNLNSPDPPPDYVSDPPPDYVPGPPNEPDGIHPALINQNLSIDEGLDITSDDTVDAKNQLTLSESKHQHQTSITLTEAKHQPTSSFSNAPKPPIVLSDNTDLNKLSSFPIIQEEALPIKIPDEPPKIPIANPHHVWDIYTIKQEMGLGSHCDLKLVFHNHQQKYYSLKQIHYEDLNKVEKDVVREEARIHQYISLFKHPNIQKFVDFFDKPEEKELILVTELCMGGELFHAIIERGCFDEHEASIIIKQLVEALSVLHNNNIIHRDLKPDNILFKYPNDITSLKLTDFGLSKHIDPRSKGIKVITDFCGTPGYVPPEILMQRPIKPPADMWAVGVITYILLCGFPPFFADTTNELFKLIRNVNFDFPEEYFENISHEAKDLIRNLLVFHPHKRLTTSQVLSHPWITGDKLKVKPNKRAKDGKQKAILRQRWRKSILTIEALNRLINIPDVKTNKEPRSF